MKQIKLTQGKYALIDDEDFERVNQYKWHAIYNNSGYWYIARKIKKSNDKWTNQSMHRFIMDTPKNMGTDHINHNGLDNRKCNLRICTVAENQYNRKPQKGTSKYKGVAWHKQRKKWMAQITLKGKHINLGRYDNETDAALAYNIKAKELFGDFAYLNFWGR